jgi:hypothetical protein
VNTTKLTLSVEPQVIREAKRAAAGWHTSVSALFTRLLRALTSQQVADLDASPVTRRATGLVELPADTKDSDLLADALASKYEAPR